MAPATALQEKFISLDASAPATVATARSGALVVAVVCLTLPARGEFTLPARNDLTVSGDRQALTVRRRS